jgi:FtsP/CotA-like multicopper oxidase with cupredoxin domain
LPIRVHGGNLDLDMPSIGGCRFGSAPAAADIVRAVRAEAPLLATATPGQRQNLMQRRPFLTGLFATTAVPAMPRFAMGMAGAGAIELIARHATAPLLGEGKPETAVWTYDGRIPGPVLRLRQGEEARIRLVNRLDEPTSVHWHGLRIANAMDGVPHLTQEPVPPGGSFDYVFTPPDAGTFWYHTHMRSAEQMARGLYGPLIVEERDDPRFSRDELLVLDDWRLNDDGSIDAATFGHLHDASHAGRLGNWLTVNGTSKPDIAIAHGGTSRVRLLNACNARVLYLAFGGAVAAIMALDGQPTGPAALGESLVISPGQRVDLFFDGDLSPGMPVTISEVSQGEPVEIATLTPVATATPDRNGGRHFTGLPANPGMAAPALAEAVRVPLAMTGGAMGGLEQAVYQGESLGIRELAEKGVVWALNGVVGMAEEPLFRVRRGQTVVIDMHNDTAWPHAMHLHGHHVRTVSPEGAETAEGPWRDTVLSDAREKTSLAFVADNPGKWLIHCHMMEHHAAGMMSWFEVES